MSKLEYRNLIFSFEEDIPGAVIKTIKNGSFYEHPMLRYIESLNLKHSIVDVGAHIGNHSIYFASFIDCDEVIAVEPHPKTYAVLIKNVKNNKLINKIKTYNVAMGDKTGRCSMQDGPRGHLGRSTVVDGNEIKVETIDNLLGKKRISLIKIDVERYEINVLKGAKRTLKKQSPFLFIEIRTSKEKKPVDKFLNPLGYKATKVFNKIDTYRYVKNPQYSSPIHKLFSNLSLYLHQSARYLLRLTKTSRSREIRIIRGRLWKIYFKN